MVGRRATSLAVVAVPLALMGSLLLVANDLPDPLPTHWNLRGEVNGTTPWPAFVAIALGCTGGALLVAAVLGLTRRDERVRRDAVTGAAFLAWLLGGLSALTVLLSRGAAAATEVRLPWWAVPAVLAAAVVAARIAFACWPRPAPVVSGPGAKVPSLVLAAGERAVYVTSLRSRGFAVLGFVFAALAIVLFVYAGTAPGVAALLVAVAVLVLSRATLRVDASGLRIGFLPGLRIRVPMERIRQATVDEIRPLEWGGWGYRVRPGRRALVLRAGPGLVLDLRDGGRFAVTVDDPEPPAALLNGLLHL
jgi:hypothetical protein